MSQRVMTYEDGQALIEELKAQNYRATAIRKELQAQGFTISEIYEMQGVTPYRTEQLKQNAKAKRGDSSSGFAPSRALMGFMLVQLLVVMGSMIYFISAIDNLRFAYFRGMRNVYIGELLVFAGIGIPQLFCLNLIKQGKRSGVFGLVLTYVLCIFGFGMYEMMDFVALNFVLMIALIITVRGNYEQMEMLW